MTNSTATECNGTEKVRRFGPVRAYVACATCGANVTDADDWAASQTGGSPRPHNRADAETAVANMDAGPVAEVIEIGRRAAACWKAEAALAPPAATEGRALSLAAGQASLF